MPPDLLTINDKAGEYPNSWYAASTKLPPVRESLSGEHRTSVCIVGAGLTGLSTALHLAEAGVDCIVLEAHRVGWGASGRNGGQVDIGFNLEQPQLEKLVGVNAARSLWKLGLDATSLVQNLISRLGIDCDYRKGIVHTSSTTSGFKNSVAYHDYLRDEYRFNGLEVMSADDLSAVLASPRYAGGILSLHGAHLHPIKYVTGLAAAAEREGVKIYENSQVTGTNIPFAKSHFKMTGNRVTTENGSVIADHLVLACNGYLGSLNPQIAKRVMPINNYIAATEPLPERFPDCLIDNQFAICDDRFVVNYYRLSADNRLLFGGGETWSHQFPDDIAGLVRRKMLNVFPQLQDVNIDYAWGGTLAITLSRLPHFAEVATRVWSAGGYSGHGVALSTLAGRIISRAIEEDRSEFDLLASIPSSEFPGGDSTRSVLLKLAMAWYATRDRLGI